MSDDIPPDEERGDPEDIGKPIAELEQLADSPRRGFFDRLATRIERRALSVEMVDMSRGGFNEVFRAYWDLIVGFLKR